jgi:hypothetical protein
VRQTFQPFQNDKLAEFCFDAAQSPRIRRAGKEPHCQRACLMDYSDEHATGRSTGGGQEEWNVLFSFPTIAVPMETQ